MKSCLKYLKQENARDKGLAFARPLRFFTENNYSSFLKRLYKITMKSIESIKES